MRKYEQFVKALNNLKEGIKKEPPYSVLEQTGIVGLFEICFELSWRAMKEVLELHSRHPDRIASPRTIIKLAYQYDIINDEEAWIEIQKTRNLLAHTYSDSDALATIEKVKEKYCSLFGELQKEIEENWLVGDEGLGSKENKESESDE